MYDSIETKRNCFEAQGKKYVEFHTTKRDGCGFHMIIEQGAFKKLSQKKITDVKKYNEIKENKKL